MLPLPPSLFHIHVQAFLPLTILISFSPKSLVLFLIISLDFFLFFPPTLESLTFAPQHCLPPQYLLFIVVHNNPVLQWWCAGHPSLLTHSSQSRHARHWIWHIQRKGLLAAEKQVYSHGICHTEGTGSKSLSFL